MMIDWKTLSKKNAEEIFMSWTGLPSPECVDFYKNLRKDIIEMADAICGQICCDLTTISQEAYVFDLPFAISLYTLLTKKYKFSSRQGSNDGIWRYISVKVVPDVVFHRHGLLHHRFYSQPRRLYLKSLWWYIHLSWQGDESSTFECLKGNSTDHIVQLTERPGTHGHRVELTRNIMAEYHKLKLNCKKIDPRFFRKIMVLNTARLQVVEPKLCAGSELGYVKELFEYFDYEYTDETSSDRSIFGLRWPFSRVSESRL